MKLLILEKKYPNIDKEFEKDHFVLQDYIGCFTTISSDMHLEQTIQQSKKSAREIVGQTKHENYINKWELVYHKALAFSDCFTKLTYPRKTTEMFGNCSLFGNVSKQFNKALDKVTNLILVRGNPFVSDIIDMLRNFTSW